MRPEICRKEQGGEEKRGVLRGTKEKRRKRKEREKGKRQKAREKKENEVAESSMWRGDILVVLLKS